MKGLLKDMLPTSVEVTFIPLVIAYVIFGLTIPFGPFVAMIAPGCYLIMCMLFVIVDALDGTPISKIVVKVVFCVVCVAPAIFVIVRA